MARILGLDIDKDAVYGVLVRTQLRSREPVAYVGAARPPYSSPLEEAESLRSAIDEVLRAVGRTPDAVVADLDGRDASIRRLSIPAGAAKRADDIVPFELEPLLPLEADEAIIDQQPIDVEDQELRLLTVAAPKARVAERLAELGDAGVSPKHLSVGPIALEGLAASLPELGTGEHVLLVEIRGDRTDLAVVRGDRVSFARTLSPGLADVSSGRRAVLEAELKRSLAAYRSAGLPAPTQALLLGPAALIPNAADWLRGVVGVETYIPELPELPGASGPEAIRYAHALALAGRVGLKGKRIELRRGEFAPAKAAGALRAQAPLLAICAAAVLMSVAFSVWARYSTLSAEHDRLAAQLGDITERYFDVRTQSPTRARELLEGGQTRSDPMPRFDAWDVLNAVSEAIPSEITHDTRRLDIEIDDEAHEGQLRIEGTVESIAQRDTIAEALDANECFGEIHRGPTSPGAGNVGLNYRLEVDVRCPGEPEPAGNRRGGRAHGHR